VNVSRVFVERTALARCQYVNLALQDQAVMKPHRHAQYVLLILSIRNPGAIAKLAGRLFTPQREVKSATATVRIHQRTAEVCST
jgi:hypothetical protein